MLLLPVAIFGLYLGITHDDVGGTAYFIVLTVVVLLGVWDAIND